MLRSTLRRALTGAALLTVLTGAPLALTGCGAARGFINARIPAIENPGSLDGKQFPVRAGAASAATPAVAAGTYTGPFPDAAPVDQQDRLTFADVNQSLRPEVSLIMPPGVALPARVTLRNISLRVRLYEAADQNATATREVTFPALNSAPEDFVLTPVAGAPNRYALPAEDGNIDLGPAQMGGDNARRLFSLLTAPDQASRSTNFVQASLVTEVDPLELPEGTVLLLTFGPGTARVGL